MKGIILGLIYCLGIQYGFQEAEENAEREAEIHQKQLEAIKRQEVLDILAQIKTGKTDEK